MTLAVETTPYSLDAEPFRVWVKAEVSGRFGGDSVRAAKAMGMSSKSVEAYIEGKRERVTLDVADRALINVGTRRLEDLWPAEFPEE